MPSRTAALLVLTAALCLAATPCVAQTAVINGTTTTQGSTVRLPGVEVIVTELSDEARVATAVSDGQGRFEVRGLRAGRFRVTARLAGFRDLVPAPVTLAPAEQVQLTLDLELASHTEDVTVVAQAALAEAGTAVTRDTVKGQMVDYLPVAGDSYRALLPVLPGVVRAPDGRMSVKGAREAQGALQVGRGYANDPSTGNFGIELPADSVESVDVLANPYGAEDGRFSSTVVRIETRAGTNQWRAIVNGFVPLPCLKLCDGESMGVRNYKPRGWFGGPIVKDRLFIAQGVQARFVRVRVAGLPDEANDTTDAGLETFTRLDANVSHRHLLAATVALFPRRADALGLNTLTPAEVSPGYRLMGWRAAVSESAMLSGSTVLESSLDATVYDADVFGPSGDRAQELTVEGSRGNYFNAQSRRTRVAQWTASVTSARRGAGGEHVLRAGVDIMHATYAGTSESRPVIVRRADGTVSERLDFGPATSQRGSGTDAAVFVQDRWRWSERFLLEPGLRIERDGVTRRTNASPRVGVVAGALPSGAGVLRGGAGVFFERSPLNLAAFESFEPATVSCFGPDGTTPLASPATFVPERRGTLRTPRSVIWNVEYDLRLGSHVLLKLNHLRRRSRDLAVVEPVMHPGAALRLESRGRARYTESEVTLRYGATEFQQLSMTYVRSRATGHQNAYDTFFGNVRTPIVRPDEPAPSPTDVPHRLLVRAIYTLRDTWTLSSLVEVRSGFPYSLVDENQEYVGRRNAGGRFPALCTWDVSLVRSGTLLGRPVRYGVRVYHLLNTFAPRDVQNNVDSPAFGTFANPIPRRVSVTFTFLPR